jgi:hypothetical protein
MRGSGNLLLRKFCDVIAETVSLLSRGSLTFTGEPVGFMLNFYLLILLR